MKNRHHIRAVLFDLDGVIVHTDRFHQAGWQQLADEEGWKFSEARAHSLRGVSRMEALDTILADNGLQAASDADKVKWADRKNSYYKNFVKDIGQSEVIPGSVAFVRELRSRGVLTALCSASKNAPDILRLLQLEDLFDTVVCGHDTTRSKPDPQVFELAAERLGVPAFHCVVFEDAPTGVEAAKRAGMKCVGVGDREGLPEAPSLIARYSEIDIEALLDSGRPFRPEPHGWELIEGDFRPTRALFWETMLAVTNGAFGVRGNLEEENEGVSSYPATLMNGIVGYVPYHYLWAFPGYPHRGHTFLNVCEWTRVRLEVDGERFSMTHSGPSEHRRGLNLRSGTVFRQWKFKTESGVEVSVKTTRIASMERRHLAALCYEVSVSAPCQVVLESETDAAPFSRMFNGRGIEVRALQRDGDFLLANQISTTSEQSMTTGIREIVSEGDRRVQCEVAIEGDVCKTRYRIDAEPGGSVRLEKTAVFCTEIEQPDADLAETVKLLLSEAPACQELFAEHSRWWERYWSVADIEIDGDPLDQLGIRLSLFHNRQSNPEDGYRSIGANGQTGDNYSGHVFWDTEQYILVPYLYSEPATVRGLLEYRYRILDKAREQARLMQSCGAEYSWNSITGEECGHVFEAAQGQVHLQCDIAWAIDRYVRTTGDAEFMHDMGAEIIFETARYLRDRGAFSPYKNNQFVFNAVCGANEYSCGVDNNATTNYMAQWHFLRAYDLFTSMQRDAPDKMEKLLSRIKLTNEEVEGWRAAGEAMYLPYSKEMGIVPQDDNFLGRDPVDMSKIPFHTDVRTLVHPLNLWRMQLIKQADTVFLMFLMSEKFDEETIRRTYEFHEARTNHGSSLSAAVHCIVAAQIGKHDDAYHFFRESALMDINDLKGNTAGGMHSACLGGTWMAVVNGFAGMRDDSRGLSFQPRLPKDWARLSFQLVWNGTRIGVEILSDKAVYRHLDGPGIEFLHRDDQVVLEPETTRELGI